MNKIRASVCLAGLVTAAAASSPALAFNVLQSPYVTSIAVVGMPGVLRPGSSWAPAPAPASVTSVFDGVFLPETTTWTDGTFWWDEWAYESAPYNKVTIEVQLAGVFNLDRFVVQADNNEDYHVEFWDGAGWSNAFTASAIAGFGMMTRDSGLLGTIQTDRLRVHATGGDLYYSLSEVQAYGVPLPGTLALVSLAGLGLWATGRRRALPQST